MNDAKENKILNLFEFLTKKRRTIFLYTFSIALLSIIISVLLPNWYSSKAVIIPPENRGMSAAGALISDLPFSSLFSSFSGGGNEGINKYISILKSRRVADEIIKKYDLTEVYDFTGNFYYEDVVKKLNSNVAISETDQGTLEFSVLDKDPLRAKEMVQSYLQLLDSLNQVLSRRAAHFQRIFIEKRIDETYKKLAVYEDSLDAYQQKNGFIALSAEASSDISTAAEIQSRLLILQIQHNLLKSRVSSDNIELKKISDEIKIIKKKIRSIPPILKKSLRIYREIKIQNNILKFLIPEYERAKIDELKDTPTIQILDPPQEPTKKTKPKRSIIVILSTLLGFFFVIGYFSFKYRLSELEKTNPTEAAKWAYILKNIFKVWSK